MTNEEKHKLLDAVIGASRDNVMGGKYYKAYECGVINAYNRLVKAIKELEQGDVLDKIRAEIANHCGLAQENHCRYCSYCNSLMGVREILDIIDKYKIESEE